MTTLAPLLEKALSPLVFEDEVYQVTNSCSDNIVRSCKSAGCVDVGDFIPKKYTEGSITSKPYSPESYRLQFGPKDHAKTPELLGFLGCRWYQPCATTMELLSFVSEHKSVVQDIFSKRLCIVALGRDLFLGPSNYAAVIGIGKQGRRELRKVELTPETRWSRKHVFLLRATS